MEIVKLALRPVYAFRGVLLGPRKAEIREAYERARKKAFEETRLKGAQSLRKIPDAFMTGSSGELPIYEGSVKIREKALLEHEAREISSLCSLNALRFLRATGEQREGVRKLMQTIALAELRKGEVIGRRTGTRQAINDFHDVADILGDLKKSYTRKSWKGIVFGHGVGHIKAFFFFHSYFAALKRAKKFRPDWDSVKLEHA